MYNISSPKSLQDFSSTTVPKNYAFTVFQQKIHHPTSKNKKKQPMFFTVFFFSPPQKKVFVSSEKKNTKHQNPGIPTTIKTMGVNIATIVYLSVLMVVEAQGKKSNNKKRPRHAPSMQLSQYLYSRKVPFAED